MKNALMIVLFVAAILASGCARLPKSDSTALQGTWKGQEIGSRTAGECSLTLSGNTLEFRGADTDDWCKGTFTLREDLNPRQLIGTITECPAPEVIGKTVYSIYRIEAGTLTITGNPPGNPDVPSGFDAPGARKLLLKKP